MPRTHKQTVERVKCLHEKHGWTKARLARHFNLSLKLVEAIADGSYEARRVTAAVRGYAHDMVAWRCPCGAKVYGDKCIACRDRNLALVQRVVDGPQPFDDHDSDPDVVLDLADDERYRYLELHSQRVQSLTDEECR